MYEEEEAQTGGGNYGEEEHLHGEELIDQGWCDDDEAVASELEEVVATRMMRRRWR
jgi:hypothetical protein